MTQLTAHPTTHFRSPDDLTATEPPEHRGLARDEVRLLVATPEGVIHTRFADLPLHLAPADLLVVNNSATRAAEFDATGDDDDPVVVHVATGLGGQSWVVELRTAPDAAKPILDACPGNRYRGPADIRITLGTPYPEADSSPTGSGNRLWLSEIEGPADLATELPTVGRPIAYGYLRDRFPLADYQTVFATRDGSAEMPSAARPFTGDLVGRLAASGIRIAPVTLHTGVSSQDAGEAPQPEWREVTAATADLVNYTRKAGGRVVAVGTTVVRALESSVGSDGLVAPSAGWTGHVIGPDHPVRAVDGMITGWHNPDASHLLLVEQVAGAGLTQRAYDAAVAGRYLWHEFGDSGLLLRR
jgi:S-adenosylmethionine:tRNA ribosyltransferase-isomerase